MYDNILVPYDGSEPAGRALAAAIELGTGSEPVNITVLQVINTDDIEQSSFEIAMKMAGLISEDSSELRMLRSGNSPEFKQQMQEKVAEYFDSLPESINVSIVVKKGMPRDIILAFADEHDIDLIVMGRRGLGGIRAALGSVSTAILRGTDLPVLVVR